MRNMSFVSLKKFFLKKDICFVVLIVSFVSIPLIMPLIPLLLFSVWFINFKLNLLTPPITYGKINDHILFSTLQEHVTVSYYSWTHRLIPVFILDLQFYILTFTFSPFAKVSPIIFWLDETPSLIISQKELVNTILP